MSEFERKRPVEISQHARNANCIAKKEAARKFLGGCEIASCLVSLFGGAEIEFKKLVIGESGVTRRVYDSMGRKRYTQLLGYGNFQRFGLP